MNSGSLLLPRRSLRSVTLLRGSLGSRDSSAVRCKGKTLSLICFQSRQYSRSRYVFQRKYLNYLSYGVFGSLAAYISYKAGFQFHETVYAKSEKQKAANEDRAEDVSHTKKMSRREMRFNEFASCEYNGQILMTPQDFLESLTENQPKFARTGKVKLRERDIDDIVLRTPTLKDGSPYFFRSLHQDGIITFSEYLFLVTVLTKSHHGLEIAFKMIDVDGNHQICKEEFQAIQGMINRSATKSLTKISNKRRGLDYTTLLVYLFGKDGKQSVTFRQFFTIMENLQDEVLELEFHEFSKSMMFISELDFARILLRNTVLSKDEYRGYLDRLKERIPDPMGVSLEQFKAFNHFLNNMDDFSTAVKMFSISHEPMSKEAFQRAVKVSTGEDIDPNVVNIVFNLFDIDGDGKLSHVEFIGIMKDRLKRGFGKFPAPRGWAGFKHCMRKQVHSSS